MESNNQEQRQYGQQIRYLRKKAGITQTQLAKRVGISLNSVQRYEKNERQPSVESLFQIANALGVTFMDLVLGENKAEFMEQLPPNEREMEEEYHHKLYWNRITTIYFNLAPVSSGDFAEAFFRCFPQLNDLGQAKVQAYLEDMVKIMDCHKEPVPRPKDNGSHLVAHFQNPNGDKKPSQSPEKALYTSTGDKPQEEAETSQNEPQGQKDGPKQEPEEQ